MAAKEATRTRSETGKRIIEDTCPFPPARLQHDCQPRNDPILPIMLESEQPLSPQPPSRSSLAHHCCLFCSPVGAASAVRVATGRCETISSQGANSASFSTFCTRLGRVHQRKPALHPLQTKPLAGRSSAGREAENWDQLWPPGPPSTAAGRRARRCTLATSGHITAGRGGGTEGWVESALRLAGPSFAWLTLAPMVLIATQSCRFFPHLSLCSLSSEQSLVAPYSLEAYQITHLNCNHAFLRRHPSRPCWPCCLSGVSAHCLLASARKLLANRLS